MNVRAVLCSVIITSILVEGYRGYPCEDGRGVWHLLPEKNGQICCTEKECGPGTQAVCRGIDVGVDCEPCPEGTYNEIAINSSLGKQCRIKDCPAGREMTPETKHDPTKAPLCGCNTKEGYWYPFYDDTVEDDGRYEIGTPCLPKKCGNGTQLVLNGECEKCPIGFFKNSTMAEKYGPCMPVTDCDKIGCRQIKPYSRENDAVCDCSNSTGESFASYPVTSTQTPSTASAASPSPVVGNIRPTSQDHHHKYKGSTQWHLWFIMFAVVLLLILVALLVVILLSPKIKKQIKQIRGHKTLSNSTGKHFTADVESRDQGSPCSAESVYFTSSVEDVTEKTERPRSPEQHEERSHLLSQSNRQPVEDTDLGNEVQDTVGELTENHFNKSQRPTLSRFVSTDSGLGSTDGNPSPTISITEEGTHMEGVGSGAENKATPSDEQPPPYTQNDHNGSVTPSPTADVNPSVIIHQHFNTNTMNINVHDNGRVDSVVGNQTNTSSSASTPTTASVHTPDSRPQSQSNDTIPSHIVSQAELYAKFAVPHLAGNSHNACPATNHIEPGRGDTDVKTPLPMSETQKPSNSSDEKCVSTGSPAICSHQDNPLITKQVV